MIINTLVYQYRRETDRARLAVMRFSAEIIWVDEIYRNTPEEWARYINERRILWMITRSKES